MRRGAFRPADKQQWIQGGPREFEYAEKYLLASPTSRRVGSPAGPSSVRAEWPRMPALSLPPGDHTLEVDVEGSFSDDEQHVWSGSTRASLHIAVPTPTPPAPTKIIAGILKLQYAPGLVHSRPNPESSGGKVDAGLWRDLPAPGQKGFPVVVPDSDFVSLRVVQRGRAPGAAASFAPLTPRWSVPSRNADFWQPGLDFAHLLSPDASAPPGGVYKRFEVKVEAQDHEVVQGVAPGQVREGEKSSLTGWILVRLKDASGGPIPPFDAASVPE